ncbi:nitrogenase stabilizing/protective protein NifW [Ampullimonas aquatilis]|uniref:nitrogenase stabilizing/protective protein NifW n=1 Tax=Ampullimonas aquatilis TaxID=1341549 RepID=UPI003C755FE9
MNDLSQRLAQLSAAEEFLNFFGVPYDEAVVNVNRLHILKRFYQYLRKADGLDSLGEVEMFQQYRELLVKAYQDFVSSTAAQEKVFKVFQDADGKSVSVESLKGSRMDKTTFTPVSVPASNAA